MSGTGPGGNAGGQGGNYFENGQGQGLYNGWGNILSWLGQGNINANAYGSMGYGANGGMQINPATGKAQHYGVQGANGALTGLSEQAVEWIQKNMMQANAPQLDSLFTTGADGKPTTTALTGHDLLMAKLHNSLAGLAPTTYGMNDTYKGMSAEDMNAALAGVANLPDMYGKGFDANGWTQLTGGGRKFSNAYDQWHNDHIGNTMGYNAWLQAHPQHTGNGGSGSGKRTRAGGQTGRRGGG